MLSDDSAAGAASTTDTYVGRAGRWATAARLVALIILLLVYVPVFAHAVDVWSHDEEFSFAFAVPPITLWLLWLRRKAIPASLGQGANLGLIPLAAGLLMLVVSARINVNVVGGVSFVVTALGAVAYLYGLSTARVVFFPITFLTFGLSLFRGLLSSLGFGLQNLTAHWSAIAASVVGVSVHRDGVDLYAGQFHFVVAQACSGMSSLLTLLCLGTLLVGLAHAALPRRLLLIALIIPIVLLANIARVTLVLTLAQVFGLAVAQGFVHGMFSAVLFLAALGLFLLFGRLLKCYPRIDALAW